MQRKSGNPVSWRARRKLYRSRSGPVSNPGDNRPRKKERRHLGAPLRVKLRDWSEAIPMDEAFNKARAEAEAAEKKRLEDEAKAQEGA